LGIKRNIVRDYQIIKDFTLVDERMAIKNNVGYVTNKLGDMKGA